LVMEDERIKPIKSDNDNDRLPNGYFAKGNKIGRMPKKGLTLKYLTKAVIKDEEFNKRAIVRHYVDELYKDNRLLENFVNRYVPTKTINELTGAGGSPLRFVIEKSYPDNNPEKKDAQD